MHTILLLLLSNICSTAAGYIYAGFSLDCTCGGADDGCVLVNGFQKLANNQRDALYPLHLLLGMEELLLQVLLFIFDVLLLHLQELQLLLQLLRSHNKRRGGKKSERQLEMKVP